MPNPGKAYPVTLAGVRSYQASIAMIAPADEVRLIREIGNPFDPDAIAVVDAIGATLGYIPRANWLRRVLIEEGKGGRATIERLWDGDDGTVGVTIAVTLTDDGAIGARDYVPAD